MADATPELAPSEATIASAHQTAGPYWHLVDFPEWADTTRHFAGELPPGERIVLTGTLRDGTGALVTDAMVEIWHADPEGRYPDPNGDPTAFQGYGRCATDKEGRFRFTTLKPGPVPVGPHAGANALQAPHVALAVFARGLLQHVCTRLYFEGEALNGTDPVLNAVPEARRGTMIAKPAVDGTWNLDLRLQGEGETVWMAV
ncbi:protocatechuate 3,4-dioxygenase subunit alpha [Muricoccus aerilatus]|uniref:protocatechuate 3,4-dioxygenase subunit alpha n=1 Tax=Muricoccus aerilatus TaxID=452982 RepID=UPI00069413B9|nr:protocatechuate 3,4-dioxygenase subunit alpha [Roseomonas aerilata]